uniref:Uncharacterized protein n=1 Tax=Arundo donax TaxID=35708 RepID=A0A0A8YNI5_ARUDO
MYCCKVESALRNLCRHGNCNTKFPPLTFSCVYSCSMASNMSC